MTRTIFVILSLAVILTVNVSAKIDWTKVVPDKQIVQPIDGANTNDESDDITTRIIGGKPAKSKQFPYQVGLKMVIIPKLMTTWCGGSLISDRYVLTAAHCLLTNKREYFKENETIITHYEEVQWAWELTAYIGGHDLDKEDDFQKIYVPANSNFIVNQNYDHLKINNDIALVYLPEPAIINEFTQIIKLPPANIGDLVGKKVATSGWGYVNDTTEDSPKILQYVSLKIISREKCEKSMGRIEDDKHLCAIGEENRSICQGDSGGPIVYQNENDGTKYVVGITSFGSAAGCAVGYPSVFTRVSNYLDWIAENTNHTIQ